METEVLSRTTEIHDRRHEILRWLPGPDGEHVAPISLGAWNGSYHSNDLRYLESKGLVESIKWGGMFRGSKRYRKTKAGVEYLSNNPLLDDCQAE